MITHRLTGINADAKWHIQTAMYTHSEANTHQSQEFHSWLTLIWQQASVSAEMVCMNSFNIFVCLCVCPLMHTSHELCVKVLVPPCPVSPHCWIRTSLWQISSVESGKKWACPTAQREEDDKVQHGGEVVLLLIAVCPILPAQGKSLFLLWLNHSLLPSLHCRDESPFVTLLRFPPSCSFSFPSVSITKTVKSTSGVIIAYIFLAMSVCALAPYFQSICFWGSRREISVELWDYTCKSATCRLKKRQKKKRKATVGERDEGLQIQISRMTSEVCDFSAVTCLRDHLSTGCFMR